MPDVVLLCIAFLGVVALLGLLAVAVAPWFQTAPAVAALRRRVATPLDSSIRHLGAPVTALIVVLALWAAGLITGWVSGRLADWVEAAIDWPVFRWFAERQVPAWSDIWLVITNMGSPRVTQSLTVMGAVVLAALWRRRGMRWWVPLIALPSAYAMEKYGQIILKLVVDRGHPPTTHGTWPSGGCARVIVVYGLLTMLFLLWTRTRNPRAWGGGLAFVGFAAAVQAYARMYNQEHWLTDVIGGLFWGWLLLATAASGVLILNRERVDGNAPVSRQQLPIPEIVR